MNIRRLNIRTMIVALPILAFAGNARGAGLQVNQQSAPATGRGEAVVATINDPSAVFYNPAGLAEIEGTEFMVGVSVLRFNAEYRGAGIPSANAAGGQVTESIDPSFIALPNIYAAHALSSEVTVGLGVYFPYGLEFEWQNPNTFVGRTVIQEVSLTSIYITPTIALKLSDRVSIAAGLSLVPSTVYLRRTIGSPTDGAVLFPTTQYSQEGYLELSGMAFGVGATAGLQVKLMEHLRLGFAYRSAVDLSFSGNGNFVVPEELPASIKADFPDQKVTADIPLPHTFSFGVGWVQGALSVEASGQLTLWNSFDELRIGFETGRPAEAIVLPRSWKATPTVRLGGQYQFGDVTVRAGAGYEPAAVPAETIDPILVDQDRVLLSVGGGYRLGNFYGDLAYAVAIYPSRDVGPGVSTTFAEGTYPSRAVHVLSASLGVRL